MTIELRRHDQLRETFADKDLVAAFRAFWDHTLGPAWDREAQWYAWSLSIPGRQPVRLSEDDVGRVEMLALTERIHERGFAWRMAELHAAAPDGARFTAAPYLAFEPSFPRIEDRLQVLRQTLSLAGQPRHLGRIGEELERPPDATFTIATKSGAFENGAGCMTDFDEWCIDVHAPLRVQVRIEASDDYGIPTVWSMAVHHEPQTPVDALLAAFRAHGFYVKDEPHLDPQ